MSTLLYFAYGSNLHPTRLRERVASARLIGRGKIRGYVLRFHKRGVCGSAKCNAHYTGESGDCVLGALYELALTEKPTLDGHEGPGYACCTVAVQLDDETHSAFAYVALEDYIDDSLQPFHWYQALVQHGARYHEFISDYIERFVKVTTVDDLNEARMTHHMALLQRLEHRARDN